MEVRSKRGTFYPETRGTAPDRALSPNLECDELKGDSEDGRLPAVPPPASAAPTLNQWLEGLRASHPKLSAWLEANSGFEVLRAYLLDKNHVALLKKLQAALKHYGYAGFIDTLQTHHFPFSEEQLWELRYQVNASLPYRYDIQKISPTAKYFVSICKLGSHNYVLAGCDDSKGDENDQGRYIFSAVGKVCKTDAPAGSSTGICAALFSGLPADFNDEGVLKTKAKIDRGSSITTVQYRAYELSYKQYVDYTKLLKKIPNPKGNNYYKAYAPSNQDGLVTNRYAISTFDEKLLFPEPEIPKQKEEGDLSSFTKLSLGNTCRHSALKLLKLLNIVDDRISSFWGTSLPNQLQMSGGKIISPLFIVPIPPELDLKKANPFLYKVLKELHGNIIRLSQTNYGIDLARRKVNALGELYKQLHKTKIDKDSYHIEAVLDAWKNQEQKEGDLNNLALISESRGHYFKCSFFHSKKTTSTAVLEKLDKMVAKKSASRRPA